MRKYIKYNVKNVTYFFSFFLFQIYCSRITQMSFLLREYSNTERWIYHSMCARPTRNAEYISLKT